MALLKMSTTGAMALTLFQSECLKMPNTGTNMPNMSTAVIKSKQGQPLSMVDALFSRTQQNVLALLFGQAEKSFYTNEIIRKSGGGSGAVQRELSRLVRSGLATVKRVGSQNHYQANPDTPLFVELCSIVNKTVALVEPLKTALQPFIQHINLAFVYGSVAKKSDTASSDIDLMIISDDLTYADVFPALEDVSDKLRRSIQPTIYSPAELTRRIQTDNSFIKRVLAQPKIWIVGKENELPTR
jgi:predicted nucleotidyltransferase